MRRMLLVAVGMCFLLGCGFDARSTGYSCESQSDCTNGRRCEFGWCVVAQDASLRPDASQAQSDAAGGSDAATIDAAPADAAPMGDPDARPLSSCTSCQGGECREECSSGGVCDFLCDVNGCDCEFQCATGTTDCNLDCKTGSICAIDCAGAQTCKVNCEVNTTCNIDCSGVNDCTQTKCENNSECLLDCSNTGNNDCSFEICGGTQTSCPGDIIACNRACP